MVGPHGWKPEAPEMSRRSSAFWLVTTLFGLLVGIAATVGHVVATSLESQTESVSATELPVTGPHDLDDAFREKLAPRDGRISDQPVNPAWSPVALRPAAPLAGAPKDATRARAENARVALERAAQNAFEEAANAVAEGEPESALAAVDEAVALARAAELAAEVAAD